MMHDHTPFLVLPALRQRRRPQQASQSIALHDLIRIRGEQVGRFGHTPEADRQLPLRFLPHEARERVNYIFDDIRRDKRDLARIHALKAAALLLAFADRLDADAAAAPTAGDVL